MENIQPSWVNFQSPGADCVMPMSFVIGRLNNAECIGLTDAQMDAEGRRRHHPAAISRFCDRVLTVEE